MRKFLMKGYNIQAPSLASIITRLISGIESIERWNDFKRTEIITGLLREVDPLIAIDGLDVVDEHEVVN
jgi:hypothetical protein